jgi:hypothetical protein
MATKTYLELVNEVLVRLREDTVSSVDETSYSALVAKWINDAKELVEDAWDWRVLTRAVPLSLVATTTAYYLDDELTVGVGNTLNSRARLLRNAYQPSLPLAFDVTANDTYQLYDIPQDKLRENFRLLSDSQRNQAKPSQFSFWVDSTGPKVQLWERPTGARNWQIYFCCPQDDLEDEADEILVPWRPVVNVALLWALNERGEEIGEPGITIEQKIRMVLSDAIAIDGAEQDDKTTFYPG